MTPQEMYHQWLGITPEEQPPTLYRLLGIADFESDPEVIRSAAERQAMHIRRRSRGEFVEMGQSLLNEIAEAKLCLIDPQQRSLYDQQVTLDQRRQMTKGNTEIEPAPNSVANVDSDSITELETDLNTVADDPHKTVSIDDSPRPSGLQIKRPNATYMMEAFSAANIADSSQSIGSSWVLGYRQECDVRIDHDTVSGMHCRIKRSEHGCVVEDLDSTNGTFLNGRRIRKGLVGSSDLLVLGGDHRLILPPHWFPDAASEQPVFFLGRCDGNEIQLDSSTVSRFHACIFLDGKSIVVEDLHSARGVTVLRNGTTTKRISRGAARDTDVLHFGDVEIAAKHLIDCLRDQETS